MTYDFPDDLLQKQRALTQVRADLDSLLTTLPYSVEPIEAWARPEGYWLATSPARPDSPGWTQEEQQVAELRYRERDLAGKIVTDAFWSTVDAGKRPEARSALKHALEEKESSEAAA
ncbi:nucleic acid-binding protein [Streptomyces sp. NPDC101234]|uniref:nucleic acid-binding protein n=1 Tax=Streptomyces sp. NPDC101234 TaxID=3366138 RepID=UPI003824537C